MPTEHPRRQTENDLRIGAQVRPVAHNIEGSGETAVLSHSFQLLFIGRQGVWRPVLEMSPP